ncbi:MAG: SDR family NAD(P)-dependent oxidoreductase [Bacteroidia bacterium]
MGKSLEGRTALVTGSSRGVGQQIALGLAAEGCNIIVHGTKVSNCIQTKSLLESYDVEVKVVGGDLSSESSVKELIESVTSLNLPIDILYNNAAVMEDYNSDFLNFSWDTWRRTMEINVFALYQMCGAFIPQMVEREYGRIVNLTSGIAQTPELAPYSSSKWAALVL